MTTAAGRMLDAAIVQNAYVVADIDDAMRRWTASFGAGPFFVWRGYRIPGARFHGRSVDVAISVAFGQCGALQIELIEPLEGTADSPFGLPGQPDSLGFHHVAVMPGDPARFIADCEAVGVERTFVIETPRGSEMSFLDGRSTLGCYVEVYENSTNIGPLYERVRRAAIGWDGTSAPVRDL